MSWLNSGLFVEVIGLVYTSYLPLLLDSNFESRLPLSEGGRTLQYMHAKGEFTVDSILSSVVRTAYLTQLKVAWYKPAVS